MAFLTVFKTFQVIINACVVMQLFNAYLRTHIIACIFGCCFHQPAAHPHFGHGQPMVLEGMKKLMSCSCLQVIHIRILRRKLNLFGQPAVRSTVLVVGRGKHDDGPGVDGFL